MTAIESGTVLVEVLYTFLRSTKNFSVYAEANGGINKLYLPPTITTNNIVIKVETL